MSSLLKRRGRIVSFRVSEEEYLNLCQATDAAGAHSISDFARHVTCHHSLVLSRTATATASGNGNTNGNGNGLPSSTKAIPANPSLNNSHTELHPAQSVVIEVNRLRERVDQLFHQMQSLARQMSRVRPSPATENTAAAANSSTNRL